MKRGLISYGGRKTNLAKRAVKQRPHIDPCTTATSQRIHFLSSGASSLPPFLSIYLILTDLFLGEEEDETEQTVRLPIWINARAWAWNFPDQPSPNYIWSHLVKSRQHPASLAEAIKVMLFPWRGINRKESSHAVWGGGTTHHERKKLSINQELLVVSYRNARWCLTCSNTPACLFASVNVSPLVVK